MGSSILWGRGWDRVLRLLRKVLPAIAVGRRSHGSSGSVCHSPLIRSHIFFILGISFGRKVAPFFLRQSLSISCSLFFEPGSIGGGKGGINGRLAGGDHRGGFLLLSFNVCR
jgi:hypothetical protein